MPLCMILFGAAAGIAIGVQIGLTKLVSNWLGRKIDTDSQYNNKQLDSAPVAENSTKKITKKSKLKMNH